MSSPTIAIIPAKRRSTGCEGKNWRPIHTDGRSCVALATLVGAATCSRVVLSTDEGDRDVLEKHGYGIYLNRPAELCQDDTPMLDVVKHALAAVPGPPDEIIVLLQPSSPLRTVETVKKAIAAFDEDERITSVVSVSPSYPIEWSLVLDGKRLEAFDTAGGGPHCDPPTQPLSLVPSRRQDCTATYKRDGVVYAFYRKTVRDNQSIYGDWVFPLLTPPDEALSIDTQADWDEAVRRLKERG